ncbi:glutathione synthetase, chloroplastic [Tanacetum coccineum]|uniref:glutathione synthase n=1 Tax=Tanacetum coccineum TaxID=301880 RepID=A0ABQ5GS68_9ASTR
MEKLDDQKIENNDDLPPSQLPDENRMKLNDSEKKDKKVDNLQDCKPQERKTSLLRPVREAAKKTQSYKEINLNVKIRREKDFFCLIAVRISFHSFYHSVLAACLGHLRCVFWFGLILCVGMGMILHQLHVYGSCGVCFTHGTWSTTRYAVGLVAALAVGVLTHTPQPELICWLCTYCYPSELEWKAKLLMEESSAIKFPSISYHLTSTKKVQHELAKPNVIEWFLDNNDDTAKLWDCFVGFWCQDDTGAVKNVVEQPEAYVMKPQREDGSTLDDQKIENNDDLPPSQLPDENRMKLNDSEKKDKEVDHLQDCKPQE